MVKLKLNLRYNDTISLNKKYIYNLKYIFTKFGNKISAYFIHDYKIWLRATLQKVDKIIFSFGMLTCIFDMCFILVCLAVDYLSERQGKIFSLSLLTAVSSGEEVEFSDSIENIKVRLERVMKKIFKNCERIIL